MDIFGYGAERKTERALVRRYEAVIDELIDGLAPERLDLAVRLASFPDEIRGFGHVKQASLARVLPQLDQWRAQWQSLASGLGAVN
jgi:indolepyruvate ferredoxin oxidoreductase